ncbi:MAG: infB [bacterium]|nr:MAG: infB [bacterium]TXT20111.1 MAG: infB [bacterium]
MLFFRPAPRMLPRSGGGVWAHVGGNPREGLLRSGSSHEHIPHHRRQRSRRPHGLSVQRGHRHLPHHTLLQHGGMGRRMGRPGPAQFVGRGAQDHRDAVRGRRRRRPARRAHFWCPGHQLHRQPGAAAVHPQSLQDRRRADSLRPARGGAGAGHARPVDLRRPFRRHGLPRHRLRPVEFQFGAGSAGFRPHRPGRDPGRAHSGDPLLRRLPHLARGGEDRRGGAGYGPRPARRRGHRRPPGARPVAGTPGDPRHLAEPGRVLPGPRAGQSLVRGLPRRGAGRHGPLLRSYRPALPAL